MWHILPQELNKGNKVCCSMDIIFRRQKSTLKPNATYEPAPKMPHYEQISELQSRLRGSSYPNPWPPDPTPLYEASAHAEQAMREPPPTPWLCANALASHRQFRTRSCAARPHRQPFHKGPKATFTFRCTGGKSV